MSYPPKVQEFLEDLSMFSDRADRIEALISIADRFQSPGAEVVPRNPETRVPGCESEVFVVTDGRDGQAHFSIAVDNPQGISAMALAQILKETLEGEPVEDVQRVSEDLVYEIFGRELSMGKSLGLTNLVRTIKSDLAAKGR